MLTLKYSCFCISILFDFRFFCFNIFLFNITTLTKIIICILLTLSPLKKIALHRPSYFAEPLLFPKKYSSIFQMIELFILFHNLLGYLYIILIHTFISRTLSATSSRIVSSPSITPYSLWATCHARMASRETSWESAGKFGINRPSF